MNLDDIIKESGIQMQTHDIRDYVRHKDLTEGQGALDVDNDLADLKDEDEDAA